MPPIFDLCEILVHLPRRPASIAGRIRNRLPVAVVRPDDNHRVMSGAPAQGASTRIESPMPARVSLNQIFWILFLTLLVFVVANIEVEPHILILGGPAMKHGHLVVPVLLFLLFRLVLLRKVIPAAGLNQKHLVS